MKDLIRSWALSKGPYVPPQVSTVGNNFFMCTSVLIISPEFKYYTADILHNHFKILGSLDAEKTLQLESSGSFTADSQPEVPVFKLLDGYLKEYASERAWRLAKRKRVTKEDLDSYVGQLANNILAHLSSVKTNNFEVAVSEFLQESFRVVYKCRGKHYLPLEILFNNKTPIKIRNHGEDTAEFKLFVEKLTELTGGCVWYA